MKNANNDPITMALLDFTLLVVSCTLLATHATALSSYDDDVRCKCVCPKEAGKNISNVVIKSTSLG